METLYGQRETLVNGWLARVFHRFGGPIDSIMGNSSALQTSYEICPIFCTIPAQGRAVIWAAASERSCRLRVGRNRFGQRA